MNEIRDEEDWRGHCDRGAGIIWRGNNCHDWCVSGSEEAREAKDVRNRLSGSAFGWQRCYGSVRKVWRAARREAVGREQAS